MEKENKSEENLCDSCILPYPTCPALEEDIEYGDGFGNDNVIACKYYEHYKSE